MPTTTDPSVTLRRGARLGHVSQRPHFEPGLSVRAYVEGGLAEVRAALHDLDGVNHRFAIGRWKTGAGGVSLEELEIDEDTDS